MRLIARRSIVGMGMDGRLLRAVIVLVWDGPECRVFMCIVMAYVFLCQKCGEEQPSVRDRAVECGDVWRGCMVRVGRVSACWWSKSGWENDG